MTVFKSNRRGAGILSDRRAALEAFANAGVIEFPGTAEAEGRTTIQYVARVRGADRWWMLDGREVGPWLLGILDALAAEASATGGVANLDATVAELVAVMGRLTDGADPVPDGAVPGAGDATT